ncbi:hypothetical protein GO986_21565 [Deinococcus sp. HMF7620]|uniref:Uncharacterized protein n=1 Tax=Deinococcus arboris TaxID=2682977 RepID=A0A7C9HUZ1_9DEIO|nr:hypothetical protein [Deinococcus arboris]
MRPSTVQLHRIMQRPQEIPPPSSGGPSLAGRAQCADWSAHAALLVAAGQLDLAIQLGGQVWDYVALGLIVQEAGGLHWRARSEWRVISVTHFWFGRLVPNARFSRCFALGRVHDDLVVTQNGRLQRTASPAPPQERGAQARGWGPARPAGPYRRSLPARSQTSPRRLKR